MKLVIGVGLVGAAVIDYFKNKDICFFDDVIVSYTDKFGKSVPFFSSWDDIDLVIVSPGVSHEHHMVLEAINHNIPFSSDIEIFLRNEEYAGVKIAVTGTNGKSTLCALLKYIFGDLAELGGNFGTSPLYFNLNSFYIFELSSYQLSWLPVDIIKTIDIGVLTNIGNHHLKYHKTKSEYTKIKKNILKTKQFIDGTKISLVNKFPKNDLFKRSEYQFAWSIIVQILELLKFDFKKAALKLESYVALKYRQETVMDSPLVINDSKSTNIESMHCALQNMCKEFILITQVFDYNFEEFKIENFSLLKKVFILSSNHVDNLNLPYYISNDFELLINASIRYSKENKLDVLFSPGMQSFEFFKNFENRGAIFNKLFIESFDKI